MQRCGGFPKRKAIKYQYCWLKMQQNHFFPWASVCPDFSLGSTDLLSFTMVYLDAVGIDIEACDRMTPSDEISSHVGAHIAQSDKSDASESSGAFIRC